MFSKTKHSAKKKKEVKNQWGSWGLCMRLTKFSILFSLIFLQSKQKTTLLEMLSSQTMPMVDTGAEPGF
jgi:hypothetical protein